MERIADPRLVIRRGQVTRRAFLQSAAGLGAAGLLSACSSATPAPAAAPAAPPSTSGSSAPASSPAAAPAAKAPKAGGRLTWISPGEPATLDIHISSSRYDGQVTFQIFDSLMYWTKDLQLAPGLATDWKVADDHLTYTLKLRPGITFHDGTPFNAQAVVKNLERIMDPATKSQGALFALGPYESSRAVDDMTLEVKTSKPFGPMMNALGGMRIMSPAAIEKYGRDVLNHPVGTGPFKFKEWVPKSHIVLVKNPDYKWGPPIYQHQGPPHVDEFTIRFVEEAGTRLAALEAGEADVIMDIPPDQIKRMQENPKFGVESTVVSGVPMTLFLNNQKPPTDDVRFRRAFHAAVSREQLNQAVSYGTWQIDGGSLSPSTSLYEPKAAQLNPYDPEKANRLFDELGWVRNGDWRMKDGQPLTLLYQTLPSYALTAEAVQAQLRDFGVQAEITVQANPAAQHDAQQSRFHIVWTQWSGIDPALLRTVFHSANAGRGWNYSHYKSPEFDALLDKADAATDPKERASLFSQMQIKLMDEAVTYPLWPQNRFWAYHSYVKEFAVHPGGETFTPYDIWLDKT